MTARRILSVSSNRADVGINAPVWHALSQSQSLSLSVLLTGSHVTDPGYGYAAVPEGCAVSVDGADLAGLDGAQARLRLAEIEAAAGRAIAREEPDVLLVAGDRLDMFPAAVASIPFNLPIAHIAGGDLSFGAVDDRLRHAMTKLSHIHFVLNRHSAARVCRMGEDPVRIHVVGAPNLDTLMREPRLSAAEFLQETGLTTLRRMRLATVHPETNSRTPQAPLDAVLEALDSFCDPVLFTAPNDDPGGLDMARRIEAYAARRPWVVFHPTLGSRLYATAMRLATTMVGNSSSGVIEAGLFGLSVINVGGRQEGRETAPSVRHCQADADQVRTLLGQSTRPATGCPDGSLYGDGQAAARIRTCLETLPDRDYLIFKRFQNGTVPDFIEPWASRKSMDLI